MEVVALLEKDDPPWTHTGVGSGGSHLLRGGRPSLDPHGCGGGSPPRGGRSYSDEYGSRKWRRSLSSRRTSLDPSESRKWRGSSSPIRTSLSGPMWESEVEMFPLHEKDVPLWTHTLIGSEVIPLLKKDSPLWTNTGVGSGGVPSPRGGRLSPG